MGTRVIHSDLELYLTGRYRSEVAARPEPVCALVQVSNKEPDPTKPFPKKLIVVHDFTSVDTSIITAEHDVGVSILCESEKDAIDLALIVHAIARDVAGNEPGNPIAAVTASSGPSRVPEEQQRFRQYFPITYAVAGKPF